MRSGVPPHVYVTVAINLMEEAGEGVPPQAMGAAGAMCSMEEVRMSMATMEAVQMREESQRRGLLVVKRSIAAAQAKGESFATFKVCA